MMGKPTGIRMNITDSAGVPVANATINMTEKNGYVMFALPQYTDSNVTNYGIGSTLTNSTGGALFTIVQTGGPTGHDAQIGNFSLYMDVYNSSGSLINNLTFAVNRSLSTAAAPYEQVPSQGDVALNAQNLFSVFTYVQEWLNR
jgi:hypothetical protein